MPTCQQISTGIFLSSKVYSEPRKLCQIQNCNKTLENVKFKQLIPFYQQHSPHFFFILYNIPKKSISNSSQPIFTINSSFNKTILPKNSKIATESTISTKQQMYKAKYLPHCSFSDEQHSLLVYSYPHFMLFLCSFIYSDITFQCLMYL